MVHGRNAVGIRYGYVAVGEPLRLRLLPLVNCRDYHHALRANDWPFHQEIGSGSVTIEAYPGAPRLRLTVNNAHATKYQATGVWYHSFDYPLEAERGLDHLEDHYQPGVFEVWLSPGEEITLMGEVAGDDGAAPVDIPSPETELARLAGVEHQAGFRHPTLRSLVRAADAFIVDRRSTGAKTIIAGYPWFTDWGRDTMIALPGLTMVTGRLEDARSILETFARYERGGLFPNNFPDVGEEPAYHTVDASLWFVNAVYSYHCYSSDRDFVASRLYPVVESVIRHYRDGTGFNIHMEDDGLIWAGAPGTALTWMDAKVGDWVVTPRAGKPVEINALWHNALMIATYLAHKVVGDTHSAAVYQAMAIRTRGSFIDRFWNTQGECLYDVVDTPPDKRSDPSVRPNQIFAVSLPFAPLQGEKAAQVVKRVETELLASYGLRSLSPKDPNYRGSYCGDPVCRDSAYHQGTVWGWLLGPFISAYVKVHGSSPETLQ
jgi:predicted glycogen debranching enzyme